MFLAPLEGLGLKSPRPGDAFQGMVSMEKPWLSMVLGSDWQASGSLVQVVSSLQTKVFTSVKWEW